MPGKDDVNIVRARVGRVVELQGKGLQARRFAFVRSSDALVTVEGRRGTKEIIDLALALEKPILPLPIAGGSSRRRWLENRELIQRHFPFTPEDIERFEHIELACSSEDELNNLAGTVKNYLLQAVRRRCFVAMPFGGDNDIWFDQVLEPAINIAGYIPVRTDRVGFVPGCHEI